MKRIEYDDKLSMYLFYQNYESLCNYFDDWILIKNDPDKFDTIGEIVVKKAADKHIETCEW